MKRYQSVAKYIIWGQSSVCRAGLNITLTYIDNINDVVNSYRLGHNSYYPNHDFNFGLSFLTMLVRVRNITTRTL